MNYGNIIEALEKINMVYGEGKYSPTFGSHMIYA